VTGPGASSPARIALVSVLDPTSPRAWSGSLARMTAGFAATGATVRLVGPLRFPLARALRIAAGVRNRLRADTYDFHWEPPLVRSVARQIRTALAGYEPDLVVLAGGLTVTGLGVGCPVVMWTDTTFRGVYGYYEDFSRWSPRTRRLAFRAEERALAQLHLFAAASEWAAESAVRDYGLAPERVAVVPFGANIEGPPVATPRSLRPAGPFRLLSVAVEWRRKGMDTAVAAVAQLRESALDVRLDIVGCRPPQGFPVPPWVRLLGFVDPGTTAGRERLQQLYAAADAFILPTTAECYGVVFCEAAAHGLPVIATDTGGVSTAVAQGVTGLLLPAGSGPEAYAGAVRDLIRVPGLYEELSHRSRQRYEDELYWTRAAARVCELAAKAPPP
jgi:glycosyltransferase involved in cell wall biosynthesis